MVLARDVGLVVSMAKAVHNRPQSFYGGCSVGRRFPAHPQLQPGRGGTHPVLSFPPGFLSHFRALLPSHCMYGKAELCW